MTEWLSAEWFEVTQAMAVNLPLSPGLSATIQCDVTGGRDGDVSFHWSIDDGRLGAGAIGTAERPDVTLSMVRGDAESIQRGELDPNVAFMQGRMKVAGSMGVMLALLPVSRTTEFQDLLRRVVDVTAF